MVNYQQVVLKCPSLVFDNYDISNDDNALSISYIIFLINKQDVEPFKNINYKNEDGGTLYSYNVLNRNINVLNFKMTNKNSKEFEHNIFGKPLIFFKQKH